MARGVTISAKLVNDQTGAIRDRIRREHAAETHEIGEAVLDQSRPLVPVETGTLRRSGFVRGPYWQGDRVLVDVGYGGAAMDYAYIVHERLDAQHPVGQAKYLEVPAIQMEPEVVRRYQAAKRRIVGG